MDRTIKTIERETGLRLFVVSARGLPERLARNARMLVFSHTAAGPEWRVACPAHIACLPGLPPAEPGEMSRLTLYGIGLRADAELLRRLTELFAQQRCRPEMITASEEEVSCLLPDCRAQVLFDRLREAFPLPAGTAGQ